MIDSLYCPLTLSKNHNTDWFVFSGFITYFFLDKLSILTKYGLLEDKSNSETLFWLLAYLAIFGTSIFFWSTSLMTVSFIWTEILFKSASLYFFWVWYSEAVVCPPLTIWKSFNLVINKLLSIDLVSTSLAVAVMPLLYGKNIWGLSLIVSLIPLLNLPACPRKALTLLSNNSLENSLYKFANKDPGIIAK